MTGFNRDGRGGKGGGFKGKGGFRPGGDRGSRPELFDVKCADCGKATLVPFRPTGERPVYCRECFSRHASEHPERPRRNDNFNKGDRGERDERGPRRDFAPRPDFRTTEQSRPQPVQNSGNFDALKKEIETMNSKLERIMVAVQNLSATKTAHTTPEVAPAVTTKASTKSTASLKASIKKATKKVSKK